MTAFLALHEVARPQDGLHPLLVAHFQRQRTISKDDKIVSLADRRGDAMKQAGPYPGTPAGCGSPADGKHGTLSPRRQDEAPAAAGSV